MRIFFLFDISIVLWELENMKMKNYSLIVIGAGAGGLVVAKGYAKAHKKVLIIERGTYGGDCTNFGCIPSKSLIASAEIAHKIKTAEKMGIDLKDDSFNADKALDRVQKIISNIKEKEDKAALEKEGIDTITGVAQFVDKHTLKVKIKENDDEIFIKGKKIVIAAGSAPFIPPINGIEETPYLTNETVFSLKKIPDSMIIIGGGPIGCELAQAFNRLGSKVSIIHKHSHILNREEEKTAELIQTIFEKEGIEIYNDFQIDRISHSNNTFEIEIGNSKIHKKLQANAALISSGRTANIAALHLENTDIEMTQKGIVTDKYCRTTQNHIYAIGDIAGPPFFTHLAENHARIVLSNLLLPWPIRKKVKPKSLIPRVTYTDPEIASIGYLKSSAIEKYSEKSLAIYELPFSEIDRAICQGDTEGFIQIITKKWSSKIIGVTIVGTRAGELLGELILAINENIALRKLSNIIHPYPTFSLGLRQTADLWLKQTVIPKFLKK